MNWFNSLFLLAGLSTFRTVQTTTNSQADPMSEDLVVQFYDKNISTQELLMKINMTRKSFSVNNLCLSSRFSCETVCPLNESSEARGRMFQKPCYCDSLCLELGDCCYDYFVRCVDDLIPKRHLARHVCLKTSKNGFHGYALIGSCPSDNSDRSLESLCTVSSSSLELPVIDLQDNSLYKNFFCAICNSANNPVYWNFSASCKGNFLRKRLGENTYNRKMMLDFIIKNCDWEFTVPRVSSNLKNCLSVKIQCTESDPEHLLLSSLCSFYAFPVCKDIQRKNPHCEMCRGNDISEFSCVCDLSPGYLPPMPAGPPSSVPSLDILFDFSSPSDHTVTIGDLKTTVKNKECSYGFLFDPLSEECVQMYAPENVVGLSVTNNGSFLRYNCKGSGFVKLDISSVILLPNGSIWIPLHKRTYNNESYFINGSMVFVCVNLTRNFSGTRFIFKDEKLTGKQILTYVGCAISIISLILLLGVYILFKDLRTLPGKNLMSLSTAMLFYHTLFLVSGQTSRPHLCMAVSVLLHYFLLATFCWMSVMAFDVTKTFTKKGQASSTACSRRSSKAAFIKYHIYAWTSPAIIVITSSVLDTSNAVFIGYGERLCWISNGKALLVVLGIPVALILSFNCVAISITLMSIWKVQKATRRVTVQRTSLPVLYIKLSSALGFTWLLGFIYPFAKVEFLAYLFVTCNSLQGFFIFLAFVANKRTLVKMKGAWRLPSKSDGSTNTTSNTGKNKTTNRNKDGEFALTTAL